jgi:ubiquinone biosynthesis monooxygenase Coq7
MFNLTDRLIISFDHLLKKKNLTTASPATNIIDHAPASSSEYNKSAQLMRINHSGEICAQALYHGQALFARDQEQYDELMQAAKEESVHLAWCHERLQELNSRPSLLSPLWFAGSYMMGIVASLYGDQYSNAFINETEKQVSKHLELHLEKLPAFDLRSRAILQQMHEDELAHAQKAHDRGIKELPTSLKFTMHHVANVFKRIAAII